MSPALFRPRPQSQNARTPGGLHLPADLPGEDFIETRQVI